MAKRGKYGYPKVVFVKRETPDNDDPSLSVYEHIEDTAEMGETVGVAVYELREVKTVTTRIEAK